MKIVRGYMRKRAKGQRTSLKEREVHRGFDHNGKM
jgi:hypothetical protein